MQKDKQVGPVREPPKDNRPKLLPAKRGDAQLSELVKNDWVMYCPGFVRPQELDLHPDYFDTLSNELRVGDTIQVIAQDRSWFAFMVVVDVLAAGKVAARLAFYVDGVAAQAIDNEYIAPGYKICRTQAGEETGFYVLREVDVSKGFHNEHRIMNGVMPWKTEADLREGWRRLAMNQAEQVTKYFA